MLAQKVTVVTLAQRVTLAQKVIVVLMGKTYILFGKMQEIPAQLKTSSLV
jgi:hypothetical protein